MQAALKAYIETEAAPLLNSFSEARYLPGIRASGCQISGGPLE